MLVPGKFSSFRPRQQSGHFELHYRGARRTRLCNGQPDQPDASSALRVFAIPIRATSNFRRFQHQWPRNEGSADGGRSGDEEGGCSGEEEGGRSGDEAGGRLVDEAGGRISKASLYLHLPDRLGTQE